MLRVEGVSKCFGKTRVIHDLRFEVPEGQMVGVIGRSGAGKSTLLRMVNQLTDVSEGIITFGGRQVSQLKGKSLRRWRGQTAMIFQQFNLIPRLDVITNVLMGRISHHATLPSMFKVFTREEKAQAIQALEQLDMADKALQRAGNLSGGQQQRVAIARAMMQKPRIMLADEPIASLDPRSAAMVMDSLKHINQSQGITVMCNLHSLETARQYCDRVIGMLHGEVVFDGSPQQLDRDSVQRIYGIEDGEKDVNESVTSGEVWSRQGPDNVAAFA
ncbi:phosphonate ABC transporter ATP-binding protein [Billgrantia endophytica]|uniref:Phosphonate ABC transporter ATP-binding protein n=1 Tax=Billgrantia endophytica TaxID=2033802 RepID=A0A2N7U1L9_9GAMM|nr:phosphonate ABC transporter ATP-binding protein [Halomonas endophytica]PMR74335.1 phosphonate ABC transporter ATP-binding protein [Halomonas endophytica]